MRTFGETKKYFEFKLEGNDKLYRIPLAASMPARLLIMMQEADKHGEGFNGQMAMLKRYMGDDADELSAEVATNILQAWAKESENNGATVGES